MAVYTDLSDADLACVLAAFGLSEAVTFKGIAEGVSNSNFLLETAEGRFILTIFEARAPREDLPFFMHVMEHLAAKGFPAPRPLPTKSGAFIADVKDKPAAIVTFLSGVSPKIPNVAQCRSAGAALARLHLALDDCRQERANGLGPEAWAPLIMPHLDLATRLRPGLAETVVRDLEIVRDWPTALPRGIIHADVFPDNVLFVGDEVGGFIDFYFACTDFLAYDVAVCLNAWCFEQRGEYNITKGAAFLSAYQAVRPLSAEELEALPLLARGAALRFFATRLADWASTPPGALVRPKDPLEYADKLDFHRRAMRAGDYGG